METIGTNTHEQVINTGTGRVWQALTSGQPKWLRNIRVDSDWQQGSSIITTCFDEHGRVMQWNGNDMIWIGTIEVIDPMRELCVSYAGSATGLVHERYRLYATDDGKTQIKFEQVCVSPEVAANYREGNDDTLTMLKQYLES